MVYEFFTFNISDSLLPGGHLAQRARNGAHEFRARGEKLSVEFWNWDPYIVASPKRCSKNRITPAPPKVLSKSIVRVLVSRFHLSFVLLNHRSHLLYFHVRQGVMMQIENQVYLVLIQLIMILLFLQF